MADKHKNDPEVVDRLVTENIKLAHWMVKHKGNDFDPDEALSLALEGLHKAAELWDPAHPKQAKFGSYASYLIRGRFSRARVYRNRQKRGSGVPLLSLDATFSEDTDRNLHSILIDPASDTSKSVFLESDNLLLEKALAILTPKQRDIITRRFGLGDHEKETLEEISHRYNRTRENIRQIEAKALDRMGFVVNRPRPKKDASLATVPKAAGSVKKKRLRNNAQQYAADYYERNKEKLKAAQAVYRDRKRKEIQKKENARYAKQKATNPAFGERRRNNQISRRALKKQTTMSEFTTTVITASAPKEIKDNEAPGWKESAREIEVIGTRPERITVTRNGRDVFSFRITERGRIIFTPYERGYTMEVPRNLDMEPLIPWKD